MDRSVLRGIGIIALAAVIIGALFMVPGSRVKKHPANLDPWVLVSYDSNNKYGTYLGNGFMSTRIMGDGVGSQNGQPLPCYVAGLYENEKLVQAPNWSDLRFYDGKAQFKIDKDAPYKQTLNMKTGILTTEATWRAGDKTLTGKIEIIVSRAQQNVGLVRALLIPNFDGILRAESGYTTDPRLLAASPAPVPDSPVMVDAYKPGQGQHLPLIAKKLMIEHSSCSGIHTSLEVRACKNKKMVVSSYTFMELANKSSLNRAVKDLVADAQSCIADQDKLISDHKAAWAKLWQKDIVIDGPKKDQQALHSCMFYLLQSVREGSQWSIPPMGLSSEAFSGHVFWDADLWMFPALILQHPELARAIVDYRYNTLPGAMANAKAHSYAGAEYAWESGYTGKEDTPPGLSYCHERHINGDVALCQWQYYLATGDTNWLKTRGYPVLKATADYWASRAKLNAAKDRYEILKVVPPDENAEIIDNSAYTNAIAKMNLGLAIKAAKLVGAAPNTKWAEVSNKLYIPFDTAKKRFIAFDNYKGIQAKQSDTELLIYPLQYKNSAQDMTDIYKNTFGFYEPKVMPNGPAMTSSAHSIIAARLGDGRKAYSEFVGSYKPYLRGPFNYFNEKRSLTYENMCFLTGAAGPIQASLFGLAGLKMDYFSEVSNDLQYSPCLPKEWNSMKITGIQWRGKSFDLEIKPGNKVQKINH